MFRTSYFAALSVLPVLVACSGSLSHDQLQSKYRASISLAAETEVFLDHLPQHTYSPQFTRAHLTYLERQGSEIESDLADASAQADDVPSLNALKQSTQELTQTLKDLSTQPIDASPYPQSIAHLHAIHQRLQADMPR